MQVRPPVAGEDLIAERARLVAACADLADRLRDHQPALYTVLTRNLSEVGVTMRLPDGERLDIDQHNPVGTEATTDPGQDLHVAFTIRLGYLDHGVATRTPDVTIYRYTEAGNAT
jgi:hypothetical protein